ncbi:MAG: SPFH domain-containing protein [Ruminococcus sp.]|nr:SPFH domain-containing protein [Ruminococcus sp.]
MGIFKAAAGSVGGTLADQWLEVYSCDGFPQGILACRAKKMTSGRTANTKGEENLITDGSTVIIHDGQCALAIDKGKVIWSSATPGENTFHSDRTGSIFHKGGLKSIAKQSFERFGYGGVAAIYQIIMYLDLKEHMGNYFEVKIPINLTERHTGASIDATVTMTGMFSFKIADPLTFYQKLCGNTTAEIPVSAVIPQMTAELSAVLRQALSKRCREGISAYELSCYGDVMVETAEKLIDKLWIEERGYALSSIGIDNISLTNGDQNLLQSIEYAKTLTDPRLAAATPVGAQAQAMRDAAKNAAQRGIFIGTPNK